jgi:hypothetical protein
VSTGLGPTDFVAIFSAVFGEMAAVRTSRGLATLTTHVGQEQVRAEEDAPRLVVVPTGARYETARNVGNQGGVYPDTNPKTFWRRILTFDALCWGDQPPASTESDLWVSYNTSVEIERELLIALAHNLGGPAAIRLYGARWEQPTDMNRRGRVLVVEFGFETPVTQEPYIVLPYSTVGGSGVQIHATIEAVFPDGQSSVAGIIIAPP